jgi:hypothetical protein
MDDARDHTPIINTPRAGLVLGQMWLDRRPLRIRQPKQVSHSRLQFLD